MTISKFELYHGVVLSQIIRSPRINIKLLEKSDDFEWSAYEITDNQSTHKVFVKSTSNVRIGKKEVHYSSFTFSESDISKLREIETEKNLLICLVCADNEVCTLEWEDIDNTRLLFEKKSTSVIVSWNNNTRLHVKCRGKILEYTIPRNRLKTFNWS
ncbi:MAG: hypothetical protein Q8P90_04385 [bacterium]|nr:hypothetical protein [bacterium]